MWVTDTGWNHKRMNLCYGTFVAGWPGEVTDSVRVPDQMGAGHWLLGLCPLPEGSDNEKRPLLPGNQRLQELKKEFSHFWFPQTSIRLHSMVATKRQDTKAGTRPSASYERGFGGPVWEYRLSCPSRIANSAVDMKLEPNYQKWSQ